MCPFYRPAFPPPAAPPFGSWARQASPELRSTAAQGSSRDLNPMALQP